MLLTLLQESLLHTMGVADSSMLLGSGAEAHRALVPEDSITSRCSKVPPMPVMLYRCMDAVYTLV